MENVDLPATTSQLELPTGSETPTVKEEMTATLDTSAPPEETTVPDNTNRTPLSRHTIRPPQWGGPLSSKVMHGVSMHPDDAEQGPLKMQTIENADHGKCRSWKIQTTEKWRPWKMQNM